MTTLYMFYMADSNNRTTEPYLYAVTDDNRVAKRFKNERNMSLFVYKEHRLTKIEALRFINKHSDKYLAIRQLYTKGINALTDCYRSDVITFAMTSYEETKSVLEGDRLYKQFSGGEVPILGLSRTAEKAIYKLLDIAVDSKIDQFEVFLAHFGRTMKR